MLLGSSGVFYLSPMFKLKDTTILLCEYDNAAINIEQPEEGFECATFIHALARATLEFMIQNRKRGSATDVYYEVGQAIGRSIASVYRYMLPEKQKKQ